MQPLSLRGCRVEVQDIEHVLQNGDCGSEVAVFQVEEVEQVGSLNFHRVDPRDRGDRRTDACSTGELKNAVRPGTLRSKPIRAAWLQWSGQPIAHFSGSLSRVI